jgi:MFS family permease
MRAVLKTPGVAPLFFASCVARLPMGAVGLLYVLHTQELTGSYARGGVVAAVYTLALGISNPLLARVADRRGQTVVLCAGAPIAAGALLVAALVPAGWLVACAALAGASQPPVGACMRTLWPVLLDGADGRHAAYATEGVLLEVVYICGPLAIVAGIGAWSLTAALVACGAFLLAGNLAFAASPVSRRWRPAAERRRDPAGALRGGGVRVLLAVFLLGGLAIGAVEVCTPAMLDAMGRRELTGVMLALWGGGSMLAGIAVSRTRAPANAPRRLAVLIGLWGVAHAALALAGTPVELALLLMLAGATIAPTLVCANALLDVVAPVGTLTEAFTWTSTGMAAGFAAGSALAGALVEGASPALALAVLGGGGVVAALLVRGARPLREPVAAAV